MEMVLAGRKAIWELGLITGIDNQPYVEGERGKMKLQHLSIF